jgi:hypothetical protein
MTDIFGKRYFKPWIFMFIHNLLMADGISDHIWTIGDVTKLID